MRLGRAAIRLSRTTAGLEVWAPAKVNLFLEVLAKRPDGFHEIETLMAPIELYDTLYLEPAPPGQTLFACRDARARTAAHLPTPPLPEGTDNIAVRAVELVRQATGCRRGVSVQLVKRIPMAAGLAGGSSDAAAALVAVDRLWQTGLSPSDLHELAAQLGSDVPFFLCGGAAVCRGRGEQIEPLDRLPPLHLALLFPGEGLSTPAVYGRCRVADRPRSAQRLVDAWRRHDLAMVGAALHNQLEPAAETLSGSVANSRRRFARAATVGQRMSGSGTSYFGVCRGAGHARRVAAAVRAGGGAAYAVRTCV